MFCPESRQSCFEQSCLREGCQGWESVFRGNDANRPWRRMAINEALMGRVEYDETSVHFIQAPPMSIEEIGRLALAAGCPEVRL